MYTANVGRLHSLLFVVTGIGTISDRYNTSQSQTASQAQPSPSMMHLAAIMLFAMLPRLYVAFIPSSSLSSISYVRRASTAIQVGDKGAKSFIHQCIGFSGPSSLFHSKSSDEDTCQIGVSRLSTLQTILSKTGAPGSRGCKLEDGDLIPVAASTTKEYHDLHQHLLRWLRANLLEI